MSSNTLLKPPMSFPRGPSDVNSQDSWDFAKVRHLGLFWQDDLCGKPFEKNETVGVWVRFPRNARQAVAVDLASCEALQGSVKRSMLSLHSLVSWFNADRAAATAVLEKALKAQSFRHLRILLSVLTEQRDLQHSLNSEYKQRREQRRTIHDGWGVEDDDREERYEVDVWSETGSKLSRRDARGTDHGDNEMVLAAAERLHEHWRSTVPNEAVWVEVKDEAVYQEWYDPRFHEKMVRHRLGKRMVNANTPFTMLPPSCRNELTAVCADVLAAVRDPESAELGLDPVDGYATVMHQLWAGRRREELHQFKLEQDDEEAKKAAKREKDRLVFESIAFISKRSPSAVVASSNRTMSMSMNGGGRQKSHFGGGQGSVALQISSAAPSQSSNNARQQSMRQSALARKSARQSAPPPSNSSSRARRSTVMADDKSKGKSGSHGGLAASGTHDETSSALFAIQDAVANLPAKWSPLLALPMTDSQVVDNLQDNPSEVDRQLVLLCLDAFQSVSDKTALVPMPPSPTNMRRPVKSDSGGCGGCGGGGGGGGGGSVESSKHAVGKGGVSSKSASVIEKLLNYKPSKTPSRQKKHATPTANHLSAFEEDEEEDEDDEDEEDETGDGVGSLNMRFNHSKSFKIDQSTPSDDATSLSSSPLSSTSSSSAQDHPPSSSRAGALKSASRSSRTLSMVDVAGNLKVSDAFELVDKLGKLKSSVLSMRPENRITTGPPSAQVAACDMIHSREVVRGLDLSGVDITGLTSQLLPFSRNYLTRLADEQQGLFEQMKPLAKALVTSSLLDEDTKRGLSKALGSLRYKVDERSLLTGAPSLESSLYVRDVTLPAVSHHHQGRRSTHTTSDKRSDSIRSSHSSGAGGSRPGSLVRGASFQTEGGDHGNGNGGASAVNPNAAAVAGLLIQTRDTLETLALRNCSLVHSALSRLRRDGLNHCDSLTSLDLSDNPWLKSEGCGVVARGINNLPQLKVLGMRSTGCAGAGAHMLLRSLKYHRVMTLDLSCNSLGVPEQGGEKAPIMRSLKSLIKGNMHLTHLDLSWNNIRSDMCAKVGEWLKSNHSVFGLHLLGNGNSTVDSRGFVRSRVDLPPFTPHPASVAQYPANRVSQPHERCWICGRWSEQTVLFDLDLAALPNPNPDKEAGAGAGSQVGGGSGSPKRESSRYSNASMGSNGAGGGGADKRKSSRSSTADGGGGGGRVSKGSSSFISSHDSEKEKLESLHDYEDLAITCHLSFDDPPFSPNAMTEEEPSESDGGFGGSEHDFGHSRPQSQASSRPATGSRSMDNLRLTGRLKKVRKRTAAAADGEGSGDGGTSDDESDGESLGSYGDDSSTSVRFSLTRMFPPGTCQYYFLVYGNGKLLFHYSGSGSGGHHRHRSANSPHSDDGDGVLMFDDPSAVSTPHSVELVPGNPSRSPGEIPNYSILVRPEEYAKDEAPACSTNFGAFGDNCALKGDFVRRSREMNASVTMSMSASSSLGSSLSISSPRGSTSSQTSLNSPHSPHKLPTPAAAAAAAGGGGGALSMLLHGCAWHKIEATTEFLAILLEERTRKFHTVNIDEEAEEEEEEEEVFEEEVEWHPRNSVFAARRFETKGSFLDNAFDHGPTDLDDDSNFNFDEMEAQPELMAAESSLFGDDVVASGGSSANMEQEADTASEHDKESVLFGGNKRSPIEMAYDCDSAVIAALMRSGLKYSRAFFPSAITDQFIHPGLREPKHSHRHHENLRQKNLIAQLHAQAELDAKEKLVSMEMLGLLSKNNDSGEDGDGDGDEDEDGAVKGNGGGGEAGKVSEEPSSGDSFQYSGAEQESPAVAAEDAGPIGTLFASLLAHCSAINSVYRHYSFVNNRNPFSMSVHTWLLFVKDTGVDSLVATKTAQPAATRDAGKDSSVATPPHRHKHLSMPPPPPPGVSTPQQKKKHGAALSSPPRASPAAARAARSAKASPKAGAKAGPKAGLSELLDKEAKSCLEMIFFTATGGVSEASSSSSEGPPDSSGTQTASSPSMAVRPKKLPSAIALNFSKQDMTRVQFTLALMALARYKQRHMRRQRGKTATRKDTDDGTANEAAAAGSGGKRTHQTRHRTDRTDASSEERDLEIIGQFEPHSFEEFLHILEVEILGRMRNEPKGCKCFYGDVFRETMMYKETVDEMLKPYELSLRAVYKKYKLSTMGCGSSHAQLPVAQFVKMMKDAGVLGDQVSGPDVNQVFLESRLVRPKELVTGDRCLSFVDFLEALARLATRIHGFWPLDSHSPTGWSTDLRRSTSAEGGGGGEDGGEEGGGSLTTLERLEEERARHQADKDAEREGVWSDPGFVATHKAVMSILELLVLSLRDQDSSGLVYLHTERRRREQEYLEEFSQRTAAAKGESASAVASSSVSPKAGVPSASSLATEQAVLPTDDPLSDHFVVKLEALEGIAEQAIHVHRARTKGQTTAFSLYALAGQQPMSNATALEELMN